MNPAATVHVAYTSTWYDPDTERRVAEFLLRNHSVRLIAQHQDSIAPQLAASKHGATSIGYNADMALQVGESVLISLEFKWAVVYAHFVRQLLGVCADEDLAATNASVCKTGWIVGERYFPGYQDGAFSLTNPSSRVPAHAKAAVLMAQTALLQRPRGQEAVFCGPLASNSEHGKEGPVKPQVAAGQCLNDSQILDMAYYVQGAIVEAVFEPEKSMECLPGQYPVNKTSCMPCQPGSASVGGTATAATACALCSAGTTCALPTASLPSRSPAIDRPLFAATICLLPSKQRAN